MPGLLKLNPDVVELPKPYGGGKNILKYQLYQDYKFLLFEVFTTSHFITSSCNTLYQSGATMVDHIARTLGLTMATWIMQH